MCDMTIFVTCNYYIGGDIFQSDPMVSMELEMPRIGPHNYMWRARNPTSTLLKKHP